VEKAACIGLCGVEPTVTVLVPGQEKVIYFSVDNEKVKRIIKEHLLGGKTDQRMDAGFKGAAHGHAGNKSLTQSGP